MSLPADATAVLVLADGQVLCGQGLGAVGDAVGEVCFNTSMTGYQEILTDPSYAGQIITFTFPHIGNVGTNPDDMEAAAPAARGFILREPVSMPANFRAQARFEDWARAAGLIGIAGVDTRALTRRIRRGGAPNGVIAHDPEGRFDLPDLHARARAWPGLAGMELAADVSVASPAAWETKRWVFAPTATGGAYGRLEGASLPHIVAVDYGAKHNILRSLAEAGARVTLVPATTSFDAIMALGPDGVFLANGPGDPAATGDYALPIIRRLIDADLPIFGICLGHQLLALALGGTTSKMAQGHRGANHPVKELSSGKVEITSMNHGFVVDAGSLPAGVSVTHQSLFDGSICGLAVDDRPIFSVQQHPEASPGPQDSFYLFDRFLAMVRAAAA